MRVYVLRGQCSFAVQQFERLKQLLAQELGVEPKATTQQLHAQIASGQLVPDEAAAKVDLVRLSQRPRHNLLVLLTRCVGRLFRGHLISNQCVLRRGLRI